MGHASHFLSRLERLSLPHLELALSLYRDADLLREILSRARLPETAERVAIALDDAPRGPCLVVTRGGGFVTCLGDGMARGPELAVVARSQLDALASRVGELRDRLDAARRLAGTHTGAFRLLSRIFLAGDTLSREEMFAIGAFEALLGSEFRRWYIALDDDLFRLRPTYERWGRLPLSRLRDPAREQVREYWRNLWALGHLAVLLAIGLRHALAPFRRDKEKIPISWATFSQGVTAIALRGAHCVARVGKPLLANSKHRYKTAGDPVDFAAAGFDLTALALRNRTLRAEIEKAVSRPSALSPTPDGAPRAHVSRQLAELFEMVLRIPEELMEEQVSMGRDLCVASTRNLARGATHRYERPEEVPEPLARAVLVNAIEPFQNGGPGMKQMLVSLPWVSRAAPEELYLPASFLAAVRPDPDDLASALGLLAFLRHASWAAEPVRSAPSPGPNEPCLCGSGKKFKRCCAVA